MNIDLAGRHFQITEGLKAHAWDKIGKLEKYSLDIVAAHIIFDVQKIRHICEIVLTGKNLSITAKEETGDMYASFDAAIANLQKQLARHHEKKVSHRISRKSPPLRGEKIAGDNRQEL